MRVESGLEGFEESGSGRVAKHSGERMMVKVSFGEKRLALLMVLLMCGLCVSPACKKTKKDDLSGGTTKVQDGGEPSPELQEEFKKAVGLYEQGDLKGAEKRLKAVTDASPNFAKAWHNRGIIAEKEGNQEKAREYYEKAASVSTNLGAPYVNLGMMALEAGRTDEAFQHFKDAVSKDKYNPQAHNNLSVLARQQGDYRTAVVHARQSLAGDSQNTNAYANLALIYYKMGYNDVAKLVVLNALKISEGDANVWNTFGLVELANNDVTMAIRHFEQAIKLNPDHVEALMNLGSIILSVRDYDQAIGYFERVLKLKPKNYEAQISVAVARRGKGELKEAEELYNKVLATDAENAMALFNLGVLHEEHLTQAAMIGEGKGNAPEDPIKQMAWTSENMREAIKHQEKAREYYQKFMASYESPKGGKDDRVQEARQRLQNIDKAITNFYEQIQIMERTIEELKNLPPEQPEQEG